MDLLIFGASGRTGHNVVQQALDHGHNVTAFVRNPSKLKITHDHLSFFQGDIQDYLSVEKAIREKDVIISALGAASPFKLDRTVIEGFRHILTAMKKDQVTRLIYLSALGVSESRQTAGFMLRYIAPKILRTEFEGHAMRENMIRQSDLSWTIIRAANLTTEPKQGIYRSGETIKATSFLPTISRADVADLMLKQVTDDIHIHKCISIMY